jgi:hypothetical protein
VVKSLGDEFGAESKGVKIPAPAGQMLQYAEGVEMLNRIVNRRYQVGVRKRLHKSRWSRPDISHAVRELSRFTTRAQSAHLKTIKRLVKYCDSRTIWEMEQKN